MYVERHAVALLTDANGDAIGYTPVVQGAIAQIRYVPDGTVPLDTNADLAITEESTGNPIVTKANIGLSAFTLAPRQPVHAVADGAALLYAAAGTAVNEPIAVKGRVKVVIASGAATKRGTFYIWIAG